jgi:integrase
LEKKPVSENAPAPVHFLFLSCPPAFKALRRPEKPTLHRASITQLLSSASQTARGYPTVKELLGHSTITTTMRYAHTNHDAKARAVAKLGRVTVPVRRWNQVR